MTRTLLARSVARLIGVGLVVIAAAASAQPTGAELVTFGLGHPIGATSDDNGYIWVADVGTSPTANDGRIIVVSPDGETSDFLTGIPTGTMALGGLRSVTRMLHIEDDLWFTATVSPTQSYLHRISTAGWSFGQPPRTMADIAETVDVGSYVVFDVGAEDTDPSSIALGPDGALYFTELGADLVLRYDRGTSALTVLTTFPDIPNPTPPPDQVDTAPTGILAIDGRLYVATLTSRSPFVEGLARVYAVEFDGSFSVHHGGLSAVVELDRDPRDGSFTVLEHGLQAGTGRVIRLADNRVLASGFSTPRGMTYDPAGMLYVATIGGDLYRVPSDPVANEPRPEDEGVELLPPRPNPAAGPVTLSVGLQRPADIRLAVHDALGREVSVLLAGRLPAGRHEATLDAAHLAPGIYVVRLIANGQSSSSRFVLDR